MLPREVGAGWTYLPGVKCKALSQGLDTELYKNAPLSLILLLKFGQFRLVSQIHLCT